MIGLVAKELLMPLFDLQTGNASLLSGEGYQRLFLIVGKQSTTFSWYLPPGERQNRYKK